MDIATQLEAVDGVKNVCDWFGCWPTFHDAEVIHLHLNRNGISSLAIHTWDATSKVDKRGRSVLTKHAVVEFLMKEVFRLSLNGFSQGNVLFGLAIQKIEKIEEGYRITLEDVYGIAGTIDAKHVSIRLAPGKPNEVL